ncbi:MAG: Tex-like N-terminal domain-containing protein, partial [Oscillospiraceae bacterium]
YRPYKQKRRTRATIAKERGLEPLADFLWAQTPNCGDPLTEAAQYIDEEKGVPTAEDALAGARDIIAETISDDAALRKALRILYQNRAQIVSKSPKAEAEDSVYRLYYDFTSPAGKVQGHQILAMNRGEREEFLKVSVAVERDFPVRLILQTVLKPTCPTTQQVTLAAEDSYDRLIAPSLERELRNDLTDKANEGAIHMFALNLKPLLMQPPVKGKVTLGLDPGYRTGCKVAVVDGTGKVLDTAVIYPTHGDRQKAESIATLEKLVHKHHIEHIAIGNGTASKESEMFVVRLMKELDTELAYMVVSEAGASVYSASKLASLEFPEYDVSLRSAVSIARRLQ